MIVIGTSRCTAFRIKQLRGFTLIELMVVVLIIGILAAVSYPSYLNSVRKGRRADAKSVLLQASQWMERFATQNNRYDLTSGAVSVNDTTTGFPVSGLTQSPIQGSTKYYNVTIAAVGQNSFTLNAAPISGTDQASDTCKTLTLTNTGAKGITGVSGTVTQSMIDECWR
jgi:type IV pilus assembly protein PilE